MWCDVVCDLENSRMRRPWPTGGCRTKKNCSFDLDFKINILSLTGYRASPIILDFKLSPCYVCFMLPFG